jgi:hypothetical protein
MSQHAPTYAVADSLTTGLSLLAVFGFCLVLAATGQRLQDLRAREGMALAPALLRATLQVLVGGPLRLHQRRMAAVRLDAMRLGTERALAMQRHPSAHGTRHLRAVPDRVA